MNKREIEEMNNQLMRFQHMYPAEYQFQQKLNPDMWEWFRQNKYRPKPEMGEPEKKSGLGDISTAGTSSGVDCKGLKAGGRKAQQHSKIWGHHGDACPHCGMKFHDPAVANKQNASRKERARKSKKNYAEFVKVAGPPDNPHPNYG